MYPEIPVLSFISAALSLVPLLWYLRARNIAAVAIGMWLSVTNLTYAVDALVWARDTDIRASVWCDISTSVITGSRIALPAACLTICIHLERLASFCQTSTPQAKLRRILLECFMCFGLPLIYVALHLIVQPRQFDLFYGFGCRPATYPTIVTILLVMIPPLFLTAATVICAGIAWRHFLVHGVKFYGKKGSISSLTRNSYLRLVGMAVSEAVFSAVLVTVVMWNVLSLGLTPIGSMPRDLSMVLVHGSDTVISTVRSVLEVEWLVTVVQAAVFFGLFACRMEVGREGWGLVRCFLQSLRPSNATMMFGRGTSEQSATSSFTTPTLPLTEVDLSLVIHSASTLSPYGQSVDGSFPSILGPSRPPSLVKDTPVGDVTSAIHPDMIPLHSPSRASAIASSHNSLESNFDPNQLVLPLDAWPQPPTSIPIHLPCCSFGEGYSPDKFEESWFNMGVAFPRAKVVTHAKSRMADDSGLLPACQLDKRHAIHVAREIR